MKKSKLTIILVVSFVFLLILSLMFKDKFNLLLERIYLVNDKEIIISNDELKTYIKSLEKDIKEYKNISSINDCISASVIYRSPTFWYDKLTINKGSNDGIKISDVVINDRGLVGVISNIYSNSSEVDLLTNVSKNITIGLTNNDKEIYGILKEYDKYNDEFIVSELTSIIDKDIYAVTTSFTDTFKEGIIIGKVLEIKDNSNGISYDAIIKPVVDYNDIRYVCVIK